MISVVLAVRVFLAPVLIVGEFILSGAFVALHGITLPHKSPAQFQSCCALLLAEYGGLGYDGLRDRDRRLRPIG